MRAFIPILLLLTACSRETPVEQPSQSNEGASNERADDTSHDTASDDDNAPTEPAPNQDASRRDETRGNEEDLPFLAATIELTGIALGRDASVERVWQSDDRVWLWVYNDSRSRILEITTDPFRKVREHRLRGWIRDVALTPNRAAAILVTDEGLRVQPLSGRAPTLPEISEDEAVDSLRVLSDGSFVWSQNMRLVHHTTEGDRVLAGNQHCTPWISPDEQWVVCSADHVTAYSLTDETTLQKEGVPRGFVGDGHELLLSDDQVWNLGDDSVRTLGPMETWSGLTTARGHLLSRTLPEIVENQYVSLAGPVLSPAVIVRTGAHGLIDDANDRLRVLPMRFHDEEVRRIDVGVIPRVARWVGEDVIVGASNLARVMRFDRTGRTVAEWSQPCPTTEGLSCGVGAIDLTDDGSKAVAYIINHGVVVFDTSDMSVVAEWPSQGTMGNELDVAADRIVHVDGDGNVIVRRVDGEVVFRVAVDDLPLEESESVSGVALSDDGSKLAIGLERGVVLVYENERRVGRIQRSPEAGAAWDLAFLPGRCRVAATFSEEAAIHECNGRQVRGPWDEGSAHFRRVGEHLFEDDTLLDARFRPRRQFSRLSIVDVAEGTALAIPQTEGVQTVYVWTNPPL